MKKKILAVLLCATMVMGFSLNSYAAIGADGTGDADAVGENKIELDATTKTPTINVTISKSGAIIANPYRLAVATVDPNGDNTLEKATITVTNKSDVPIGVKITGKIEIDSGADSVSVGTTKAAVEAATTKQVYVQAIVTKASAPTVKLQTTTKKTTTVSGVEQTTYTYKEVAPVVYSTKGTTIATVPVLAAGATGALAGVKANADLNGDGKAQSVDAIDIIIDGAVSTPTTVAWKGTDVFKVTTTYDIQMAKNDAISGFASAE